MADAEAPEQATQETAPDGTIRANEAQAQEDAKEAGQQESEEEQQATEEEQQATEEEQQVARLLDDQPSLQEAEAAKEDAQETAPDGTIRANEAQAQEDATEAGQEAVQLSLQEALGIVTDVEVNERVKILYDPLVDKLFNSAKTLATIIGTIANVATGGLSSVASPIHPSLQDLSLSVPVCSHTPDGKRYVPWGNAEATRLGISTAATSANCNFPHVLTTNPDGDAEWWVETNKSVVLRVDLNEFGVAGLVSGVNLSRRLNALGSDVGPLFAMHLKMNAKDEGGNWQRALGAGPNETFSRPITDSRGTSQLLVPSESTNSEHYVRGVEEGGFLRFSFSLASGVSSHTTLPRNASFVIEVVSLHPKLKHLHAVSVPFKVASKFRRNGAGLDRGEIYIEGPETPIRLTFAPPRGKKRPVEQLLLHDQE